MSILPPPMTATEHRLILSGQLLAYRDLVPFLDADGLLGARRWLRHADTVETALRTPLAELRALLLDAVCRRLAELNVGPLEYFAAELLPVVPDDPGALS